MEACFQHNVFGRVNPSILKGLGLDMKLEGAHGCFGIPGLFMDNCLYY